MRHATTLIALAAVLAAPSAAAQAPAAAAVPPGASASAASARPGKVDGATAAKLARAGARLVDVRTAQEFAAGHVPGAIHIPYDELDRRAEEIGPPTTEVVLYCRTGRRSAIAARTLEGLGFTRVWDMGPLSAWPSGARPDEPPAAQ
jgi:rhodanese-related sulfurtransferase